jgi:hypothetical protein
MQEGIENCLSFSPFVIMVLEKKLHKNTNMKRHLGSIPFKVDSKPKSIWLGQNLLTLKLPPPILAPMLPLSPMEI